MNNYLHLLTKILEYFYISIKKQYRLYANNIHRHKDINCTC